MEEFIGKIWHRFVTSRAEREYPAAAVELDEIRRTIGIFFRALGGAGGLRVETSTRSSMNARRSLLERIAGTGKTVHYAWRDEETLRLPQRIALFPERARNRDLYFWLTALSVVPARGSDWIRRNQSRTRAVLAAWPGLSPCYRRLLAAHLQQRPDPATLPADEAAQETAIRRALQDFDCKVQLRYARYPPRPVPLWLHPAPPVAEPGTVPVDPDTPAQQKPSSGGGPQQRSKQRKRAERVDAPAGKDGLMSFRLESLWSWAEYSRLDRATSEEDDDDAMRTAEDLDFLSLARDSQPGKSRIRLDLDLPASAWDDIVLAAGIPVDEWDYRQQRLLKGHCRLQRMTARHVDDVALPARLQPQARRIRRQFEMLRPQRRWVGRQNDGSEVDLENYLRFLTDRRLGQVASDFPVYRALQRQQRDLACLLLADLSLSTDTYVNDEARVIDVIRDGLHLFSEALNATGDRFALHGFSSRHRNHVRFYTIKSFDEPLGDAVRGRINAVKPGYYTRMGAAIRYATGLLAQQPAADKLLLMLTDGKPNDLDRYEGRYGIEDTRQAVLEAERQGLQPFCVTVDERAEDYLPYLFGSRSWVLIRDASELPRKLPLLYLRLTR